MRARTGMLIPALWVALRLTAAFAIGTLVACPIAAQPLTIHEWGTFTSFQDESGATIGGINVDDEPVPSFVHRLNELPIWTERSLPASWSQGTPRCHPDVTLRLETPVVYFYTTGRTDRGLDFRASPSGGWLTEYFPAAQADNPQFPDRLTESVVGQLLWSDLRIGAPGSVNLPVTRERVWLAPRQVRSAIVTTGDGRESEQYLFYRGVAHLDAPLVVRRQPGVRPNEDRVTVALRAEATDGLTGFPASWLVLVHTDGRGWYSGLRPDRALARESVIEMPGSAGASLANLDALRSELRHALISEGLFADEAEAMLNTWEPSYFKAEGLRLFFLLPRDWIDRHLPIAVSEPADITRVMMGRIELVSPHQEEVLAQVLELPPGELQRKPLYVDVLSDRVVLRESERPAWEDRYRSLILENRDGLAAAYEAFGREVPPALELYDSLGRFQDALLVHRLKQEADDSRRAVLAKFIEQFSACRPQ